jgi:hypothetical protein
MRPHDGRVDHQPFKIGFACQDRQHVVEHTHLDPAIITSLHYGVVAKPFRQVTPATARTRHPQQRIQKQPVVRARTALAFRSSGHKPFDPIPLIVPKRIAIHRLTSKSQR